MLAMLRDGVAVVGKPQVAAPRRTGLGDVAASVIKATTFGWVKPCPDCTKRMNWLNGVVSWPSRVAV